MKSQSTTRTVRRFSVRPALCVLAALVCVQAPSWSQRGAGGIQAGGIRLSYNPSAYGVGQVETVELSLPAGFEPADNGIFLFARIGPNPCGSADPATCLTEQAFVQTYRGNGRTIPYRANAQLAGVEITMIAAAVSEDGQLITSKPSQLQIVEVRQRAQRLSQFGITWTFDRNYPVGQFANGDWWVAGPVTITSIRPPSVSGPRVMNGSMINPSPRLGLAQGYDNAMYGQYRVAGNYASRLNVALDVSPSNPLVVRTGSSLVSTRSHPTPDLRPQLKSAAVLTVLPLLAEENSFRPPYSGLDKSLRFQADDLRLEQLATLPLVSSTPKVKSVERMFERPWIDHVPGWAATFLHPTNNMPAYGRELTDQVGFASLLLHLNFQDSKKKGLLIRFVQTGIDLYGVLRDGGTNNWDRYSSHSMGRKWPILFAGLLLDDPIMSGIGQNPAFAHLAEDSMTFFVEETSPGVYNRGIGGYNASQVGLAEWGSRHWVDPSSDRSEWLADPYRLCCTAHVWYGEILAARIMGAQALWNHDPVFEYLDRYLEKNRAVGPKITPWQIAWSEFPLEMWDTYRSDY